MITYYTDVEEKYIRQGRIKQSEKLAEWGRVDFERFRKEKVNGN